MSSARFVFNYAMAQRHFPCASYLANTHHGLAYLRAAHRKPDSGGYAWQLRQQGAASSVADASNHCYGLAFVLLACAQGRLAGVAGCGAWLEETCALAEARFWEPAFGLYADEASADWQQRCGYRGQNANMHMCEAMLTAFEATQDDKYLQRAHLLAQHITRRQAELSQGLIWEHFHSDWSIDWDFNRDDKTNIFKPWGHQPGHLLEWAKLLLILERQLLARGLPDLATDWLLPRAIELFEAAVSRAWDPLYGGLHYGFAPDGRICDGDKYFWVQAEGLAAAALLARRTGAAPYWDWYERLWAYSWQHFVDHRYGAWYRVLGPDNRKLSDQKSPPGKTDYHTMGACYEVLTALAQAGKKPSIDR